MNAKLSFPLLALFIAGLASATSQVFTDLDSDKDLMVNKQEAEALPVLYQVWGELDTDGDGMLSENEFAQLEVNKAAETDAAVEAQVEIQSDDEEVAE